MKLSLARKWFLKSDIELCGSRQALTVTPGQDNSQCKGHPLCHRASWHDWHSGRIEYIPLVGGCVPMSWSKCARNTVTFTFNGLRILKTNTFVTVNQMRNFYRCHHNLSTWVALHFMMWFSFLCFFIPFFVKLQRKKYNQLVEWHTATTSSSSGSFLHMIEWGFGVCMYMCVSSSAMLPGANLTFQSTLRGSSLSSGIFRPVIVISQQKDKTYSPYWLCYKKRRLLQWLISL